MIDTFNRDINQGKRLLGAILGKAERELRICARPSSALKFVQEIRDRGLLCLKLDRAPQVIDDLET